MPRLPNVDERSSATVIPRFCPYGPVKSDMPARLNAMPNPPRIALSPSWLAFFGALIFALHPAAVYAVAYLNQRSTLMATLFTLVMWRLFLEGLIRVYGATTILQFLVRRLNLFQCPPKITCLLLIVARDAIDFLRERLDLRVESGTILSADVWHPASPPIVVAARALA